MSGKHYDYRIQVQVGKDWQTLCTRRTRGKAATVARPLLADGKTVRVLEVATRYLEAADL